MLIRGVNPSLIIPKTILEKTGTTINKTNASSITPNPSLNYLLTYLAT
jgi:hypothetical protein